MAEDGKHDVQSQEERRCAASIVPAQVDAALTRIKAGPEKFFGTKRLPLSDLAALGHLPPWEGNGRLGEEKNDAGQECGRRACLRLPRG